jgi:hypothetical protein
MSHRGPDYDHGNLAAYYLLYFHEKRNPERSRGAPARGGRVRARAALTVTIDHKVNGTDRYGGLTRGAWVSAKGAKGV